jgi:hypothetical protein
MQPKKIKNIAYYLNNNLEVPSNYLNRESLIKKNTSQGIAKKTPKRVMARTKDYYDKLLNS